MKTRKLSLRCPVCGSGGVFYSCTPNCCFNHVCNDCRATFEPVTRAAGGSVAGLEPPDPPPDSTGATAECGPCGALTVVELDDGRTACLQCGALLDIEYTEVAEA